MIPFSSFHPHNLQSTTGSDFGIIKLEIGSFQLPENVLLACTECKIIPVLPIHSAKYILELALRLSFNEPLKLLQLMKGSTYHIKEVSIGIFTPSIYVLVCKILFSNVEKKKDALAKAIKGLGLPNGKRFIKHLSEIHFSEKPSDNFQIC